MDGGFSRCDEGRSMPMSLAKDLCTACMWYFRLSLPVDSEKV